MASARRAFRHTGEAEVTLRSIPGTHRRPHSPERITGKVLGVPNASPHHSRKFERGR